MTKRKYRQRSCYRHTPAEWKTLREDRRAAFLDQLSDHLPPTGKRVKQIRSDLAAFDAELRQWWVSPSPRRDDLNGILSRLTKAEVRFHRRIQAELGLPLEGLLPGQLRDGWWEGRLMPAKAKRALEARTKELNR